jgi:ABC-2 type transport system ATP-binding protein
MLTVQHLRKEFTTVVAVDDVSFTVARGQVFGLIGPNGAGKSTTIRMIMDIIQPDKGEIFIDSKKINDHTKNIIGYLPEERGLYKKNKLMNVIAYFAALKGMSSQDARAAAEPWLEKFSLTKYAKRNVEELSKGNQQKVQFIISILHQPQLLVLDELFSGLDPVNQVLMRDALLELKRDNRAVIFSTHQMDTAEKLCDDLILINKGKIVLEGAPAEIKHRFGKNSVKLDYSGDGSFLHTLPGVLRADVAQNFAELEIAEGTSNNDLLASILPRLEVSSFARIEPSLQSVFIDIVGLPANEEDVQQVKAVKPKLSSRDPRLRKALLNVVLFGLVTIVYFVYALSRGEKLMWPLLFLVGTISFVFQYVKTKKKILKEMEDGGHAS